MRGISWKQRKQAFRFPAVRWISTCEGLVGDNENKHLGTQLYRGEILTCEGLVGNDEDLKRRKREEEREEERRRERGKEGVVGGGWAGGGAAGAPRLFVRCCYMVTLFNDLREHFGVSGLQKYPNGDI